MGTIEAGKNATLLVCEGDIFDMRSSIIDYAFIEGRAISLGNKQLDLFHKFAGKYGIK